MIEFPRVVRIEPASACNLGCSHCPTGTVDMHRGIMNIDLFRILIEQLKPYRDFVKVVVLYHGGEPLLNRDFFDLVVLVKAFNLRINVKTVTNGMLFNDKKIEELFSCGLDEIEFSLDGESVEENDRIRTGCRGRKVMDTIHKILTIKKQFGFPLKVFISTTQFNENKVPKWLAGEFEGKVDGFKVAMAIKWPDMKIDPDLYRECSGWEDLKNHCDHVVNTITVRHNGDVVPCCYDLTSWLVMGDIFKQTIGEIWNGEKYQALRQSIRSRQYNSTCQNCHVVNPNRLVRIR